MDSFEQIGNSPTKRHAEDVIRAMQNELTGDFAHDEPILQLYLSLPEAYCENDEALRAAATGYLLIENPDATPQKYPGMIRDIDLSQANQSIQRAKTLMAEGDINAAVHEIIYTVSRLNLLFLQTKTLNLYDFDDFEAYLYAATSFDQRPVRKMPFPIARANQICGRILLRANQWDDAEACFRKALAWNPVNADFFLDIAVACDKKHNADMHKINTTLSHPFAATRDQLRRYYFELAADAEARNEFVLSAELYKLSLTIGENERARAALSYLERMRFQRQTPPLDRNHLTQSCRKANIPLGASPKLIAIMSRFIDEHPDAAQALDIPRRQFELEHLLDNI